MLRYSEVVTNLQFIKVSTMSLELCGSIGIQSNTETEDGAYAIAAVESYCQLICLDEWRLHIKSQLLILNSLKPSKSTVDRVIQFSLRLPEL